MRLNKKKNKVVVVLIILVWLIVGIVTVVVLNWVEKEKTTDISQYEKYMGSNGSHSGSILIDSNIFPDTIPESAKVEEFYYDYYNPWDPCFLVYLVYTCSDEDYETEINRLEAIKSSNDYEVYGLTGFTNKLCAVTADSYYGIIYAMTEESENKIIYVEITACNYFTDIKYEQLIDNKYLPYGFDMTYGNPTKMR